MNQSGPPKYRNQQPIGIIRLKIYTLIAYKTKLKQKKIFFLKKNTYNKTNSKI